MRLANLFRRRTVVKPPQPIATDETRRLEEIGDELNRQRQHQARGAAMAASAIERLVSDVLNRNDEVRARR